MKCSQCRKQLIDFITGQSDKKLIKDMKIHLKDCVQCRHEAKQLEIVWKKLGNLPEIEPSPELRIRFHTMLNKMKTTTGQQNTPSLINRIKNNITQLINYRPVTQYGFALLFITIGLILGSYLTSLKFQQKEISELRQKVKNLNQVVSLALLDKNESVDRLKGITYINRINNPEQTVLTALIQTLNSDPNVNVRLAAVDALERFLDRNHIQKKIEQSLIQQSSPLVQISLIDLLAERKKETAAEVINYLIRNEQINPEVKAYAEKKFKNQI